MKSQAQLEAMRRYNKSPKGRASRAKWAQTPAGIESNRRAKAKSMG